jgi:ATP-dependent helicase/nuclease subunit A
MAENIRKIALTESQRTAVSTDSRTDRVVVAMAGSGKTTVLTEYYINLLKQRNLNPDSIVAITFTEKAARSMRVKLMEKLHDEGMIDIARQLYSAPINTMHSYFSRLLKQNALTIELDPDFQILDDASSGILKEQTLRDVMAQWKIERSDDYKKLLARFDWGHDPYDRFDSVWHEITSRGYYPSDLKPGLDPQEILGIYKSRLSEMLDDFIGALSSHIKKTKTAQNQFESAIELKEELVNVELPNLTYELAEEIDGFTAGGKISGRFSPPVDDIGKDLKHLIGEFACVIKYCLGHDVRKLFIDLIADFNLDYSRAKNSIRSLDYSDIEYFARKLLSENPEIRSKVKRDVHAFLIDEFQDTNPLQMQIIDLIRPENAFFAVGDPRQSIYGFRHADVKIMMRMIDESSKTNTDVVALGENFRSRSEILNFVSELFENQYVDSAFVNQDYGRIVPGRVFSDEPQSSPVEIILTVGEKAEDARTVEASAIANHLAQTLNEGLEIEDRETGKRKLKPSDCAILFRTRGGMLDYAEELEKAGIPYSVTDVGGFYTQREIMDLVNFLELLLSPRDALFFSQVIRAPFHIISQDGLFRIISQLRDDSKRSEPHGDDTLFLKEDYWKIDITGLSESDSLSFSDFQNEFKEIRDLCDGMGPSQRLRLILKKTHFRTAVSMGHGGRRRLSNINKFIDIADDFEKHYPGNNIFFVNRMKDLRFRDVQESQSSVDSDSDNVVLMTIHKAKGLEYPLVILADALHSTDSRVYAPLISDDGTINLQHRPESGMNRQSVTDLALKSELDKRKEKNNNEERRLLYVALTRAMDKLIISIPLAPRSSGVFKDTFSGIINFEKALDEVPENVECGGMTIPVFDGQQLAINTVKCKRETQTQLSVDVPKAIERIQSWSEMKFSNLSILHSVSEFTCWTVCPRLYEHRYYLGLGGLESELTLLKKTDTAIPDEIIDDEENTIPGGFDEFPVFKRGIIIHKMLQRFVAQADKFNLESFISSEIPGISSGNLEKFKEIIEFFRANEIGISLIKSKKALLERSLLFRIPSLDTPLRAIPDAVWNHGDEWFLVDYKSGSFHDESDSTGKSYAEQIRAYVIAVKSSYHGRVSKANLIYVDEKKILDVDITESALDQTVRNIGEFLKSVSEARFEPSPGKTCAFCNFGENCPVLMKSS